ncbi:hypothetical protein BGW38_009239 [Lunasporangiospora selenospora]|uniref:Uncharacterized protein n=1 Tax=Lunasporangiospora selenospora TaxID=979761 RepID=A0A9P6KFE1_9FUNG|nr:hypothetical protein BGW38_009239 [Lunasporangiospora selenospora]
MSTRQPPMTYRPEDDGSDDAPPSYEEATVAPATAVEERLSHQSLYPALDTSHLPPQRPPYSTAQYPAMSSPAPSAVLPGTIPFGHYPVVPTVPTYPIIPPGHIAVHAYPQMHASSTTNISSRTYPLESGMTQEPNVGIVTVPAPAYSQRPQIEEPLIPGLDSPAPLIPGNLQPDRTPPASGPTQSAAEARRERERREENDLIDLMIDIHLDNDLVSAILADDSSSSSSSPTSIRAPPEIVAPPPLTSPVVTDASGAPLSLQPTTMAMKGPTMPDLMTVYRCKKCGAILESETSPCKRIHALSLKAADYHIRSLASEVSGSSGSNSSSGDNNSNNGPDRRNSLERVSSSSSSLTGTTPAVSGGTTSSLVSMSTTTTESNPSIGTQSTSENNPFEDPVRNDYLNSAPAFEAGVHPNANDGASETTPGRVYPLYDPTANTTNPYYPNINRYSVPAMPTPPIVPMTYENNHGTNDVYLRRSFSVQRPVTAIKKLWKDAKQEYNFQQQRNPNIYGYGYTPGGPSGGSGYEIIAPPPLPQMQPPAQFTPYPVPGSIPGYYGQNGANLSRSNTYSGPHPGYQQPQYYLPGNGLPPPPPPPPGVAPLYPHHQAQPQIPPIPPPPTPLWVAPSSAPPQHTFYQ